MFERHHQPVISHGAFTRRLVNSGLIVMLLVAASLALGTLGYRSLAGLEWVDAFLNASMILTGMGPVDRMDSTTAKVFASFYALFSGAVFSVCVGIMGVPILHRFLHRFHMVAEEDRSGD